jgi:fructose-specific PTS system IIA-like component
MACGTTAEIEAEIVRQDSSVRKRQPLIDPELVIVSGESCTKEESIRELVDAMYVTGRTDDPDALENAVWAREAAYPTGVGHGFAIPHARSDSVSFDSVAVLKLKQPIAWSLIDQEPVGMVVMLAVRESEIDNCHMRVLATLARKLMDERFRQGIAERDDSHDIANFLTTELELPH